MKLLICIDDTDNLGSKGTGSIADELRQLIEKEGYGHCGFVTRHQLLLHKDIPYTSHNSSMCFDCEILDSVVGDPKTYEKFLSKLYEHLKKESATGSDPGLAVAKVEGLPIPLILNFGMSAKRMILTKEEAYKLADQLGIYLQEAGGTGQGVIGALAGIGLRLGGNDGELKGAPKEFIEGEIYTVAQLMENKKLQVVWDQNQNPLSLDDRVLISWKAKFLMEQGKVVLRVILAEGLKEGQLWKTMSKKAMRKFGDERIYKEGCDSYQPDVEEELVVTGERSCLNCRFRRWTEEGFLCVLNLYKDDKFNKSNKFDIVVIGAGVIGGFVARHLMKTKLKLAILEKNSDVCCEGTRSNSAVVHSGYNGKPGSIKGAMTVKANENFHNVCQELQVEFERCGSLMVAVGEKGMEKIKKKYEQGQQNNVKGLCILSKEEALKMEPNLNPHIIGALYAPSTGIVNPWEFGLAAVENAVENGAELFTNTKVIGIQKRKKGFLIKTNQNEFRARYVINCAGLYSDEVSNMVNEPFFAIKPRRGEYYVLDTEAKGFVNHVVFSAHEDEDAKGVLVTPTVHGNILVGPTAFDIKEKDDYGTNLNALKTMHTAVCESVAGVPFNLTIRSFSGIRARPNWLKKDSITGEYHTYEDDVKDFIIQEVDQEVNQERNQKENQKGEEGFFNVAGIKSPGLTCADEIGQYVAEMVLTKMALSKTNQLARNENFNPCRREVVRFAQMSPDRQEELIRQDKNYGRIVCRCRKVTEAEVIDAINRKAGATSLDGVKRRAGTCLGRCQGSFCTERILRILSRELNIPMDKIDKNLGGATVVRQIFSQSY